MADVRFCRDCRHIKIEEGSSSALCTNPKQPIVDLVHGGFTFCLVARLDPSKLSTPDFQTCGPMAQWFEPKEDAPKGGEK